MSRQDYATPPELIDAVERRFGPIVHDLAATAGNTKAATWYGPDLEPPWRDSLAIDWAARHPRGNLWLNPPFARVAPWMAKCKATRQAPREWRRSGLILSLTLATVGSRWFIDYVHGHALVMPLCPRVTFVGERAPINRDLMLCAWGEGLVGFAPWVWR